MLSTFLAQQWKGHMVCESTRKLHLSPFFHLTTQLNQRLVLEEFNKKKYLMIDHAGGA
jgi:hypothetical protein